MLYETFVPLTTAAAASTGDETDDANQGLSVTDATDQAQAITEAIQNMEDTINTLDPVRKAASTFIPWRQGRRWRGRQRGARQRR